MFVICQGRSLIGFSCIQLGEGNVVCKIQGTEKRLIVFARCNIIKVNKTVLPPASNRCYTNFSATVI